MTTSDDDCRLDRESVLEAHERIKKHIHHTPLFTCGILNGMVSTAQNSADLIETAWAGQKPSHPKMNLFFKCENFQKIGAFKIRGASHALSRLSKEELARGVITHSSGNHSQALALAAKRFGATAHIIMPTISTPSKIAATKGYGARVYFSGSNADEREAMVEEIRAQTGAILIPPYDHPHIIQGQGTMALEIEEQYADSILEDPTVSAHDHQRGGSMKHLDAVIAPLGGGGMLAGIATALHPTPTRVYGAEPSFEGGDDGRRGILSGERITKVSTLTIADGLRTPVGELNWKIISDTTYVNGIYSVTEDQITHAMRLLMEYLKVWVEPSAAVGLAVALYNEDFRHEVAVTGGGTGWDICIVLSGGNITMEGVAKVMGCKNPGPSTAAANMATAPQTDDGVSKAEREEGKVGFDGSKIVENVPG